MKIGTELIALHTMEITLPRITQFNVVGTNEVVKVRFAEVPPSSQASPATGEGSQSASSNGHKTDRVYINDAQYFDGVPQTVWEVHIGGYRVAEKWLKDRKSRLLSYDDLTHYQNIIAALNRTLHLQLNLDEAIEAAGVGPCNRR